jgi:hypothetical protein
MTILPRAPFCLKPNDKKEVLTWLQNLKFHDGYCAGLRCNANIDTGKLNNIKSHDYHVIMERLLPIMFHGYV